MKGMKGEAIPQVEKQDANPKNGALKPEVPERSGTGRFVAAEFKNKALTPNSIPFSARKQCAGIPRTAKYKIDPEDALCPTEP